MVFTIVCKPMQCVTLASDNISFTFLVPCFLEMSFILSALCYFITRSLHYPQFCSILIHLFYKSYGCIHLFCILVLRNADLIQSILKGRVH